MFWYPYATFSILERIDVGETNFSKFCQRGVNSNFQYPRTDRRG